MEANKPLMSSHLPAGFRFYPTDQELINCYLSKKVACSLPQEWDIIANIDLYKLNPWELPEKAFFGEGEWFFFTPRERKYPNGVRPNRAAASGYWKATGTDKPILDVSGTQCIGVKKNLVFYKGRPPKGTKTEWIMHEYRLLDSIVPPCHSKKQKAPSMRLDDWVLCRVRQKGNLPAASDEAAETSSPPQSSLTLQTAERQNSVVESSSLNNEWNDNQLLGCFLDCYDHQQRDGSAWEVSDPADFMRYAHLGGGNGYVEAQQIMPALIGSMKRKLSYGMLDELMLLPHGKRMQYYSSDGLLPSPTDSDSVNQGFPDQFFISQY